MYITNFTRLLLGLEGTPNAGKLVIDQAVLKTGFTGYVAPDYSGTARVEVVVERTAPTVKTTARR